MYFIAIQKKEIMLEELEIAKKKEIFTCGIKIIIILIFQNLGLAGHIQQKIRLLSPN